MKIAFVVGPPRSGTTAVGEFLGSGKNAALIHEPSNFHTGDRSITSYFDTAGTDADACERFKFLEQKVRELAVEPKTGVFPREPLWRAGAKLVLGNRTKWSQWSARLKSGVDTVVWKDPFVTFSLHHISDRRSPIFACFRPPLALAASYKRLNWKYSAAELADAHGLPFKRRPRRRDGPAYRGAEFWRLSYEYLLRERENFENFTFVSIDELVGDADRTLRRLFRSADIEWSATVSEKIEKRYGRDRQTRSAVPAQKTHTQDRDLTRVNAYWQHVLTEDEIAFVQATCDDLYQRLLKA